MNIEDLGIDIKTIEKIQDFYPLWEESQREKLKDGEFQDLSFNGLLLELLAYYLDRACW